MKFSVLPALTASLILAAPPLQADLAEQVKASGVTGGIVVHLNCGDGTKTLAAGIDGKFLVQGLDTDPAKVMATRKNIRAAGRYGTVTARRFDGTTLPYVDNLVNLIVADKTTTVPQAEILRVLVPGGVAVIAGKKTVKPRPKDIDDWTHYLHGPDNNAVAADRVVNRPRSVQWAEGPTHGRSHEQLASLSAAVTTNGRLFYIADYAPPAFIRFDGQWKLVARDAFNGTLLWKKDIPRWSDHLRHFRAGPIHLPRRLVAAEDTVYATLGLAAPVSVLDAATGKVVKVLKGTERTEEIIVRDGTVYLVVGTSEVHRTGGGLRARGEPEPTEERYITAVNAATGTALWKHDCPDGAFILPQTLTVGGPNVFYQSTAGVVRLNASDGAVVWKTKRLTPERRMSFSSPTVVATDEVLLCADRDAAGKDAADEKVLWGVHGWNEKGYPRKGKTTLRAYSVETGEEIWSAGCSEGYNSPVDIFVIDGNVWAGLNFKCYDLKTGTETRKIKWTGPRVGMPHHRCYRNKATVRYIYTGRSGIEMVDLEKGNVGNNSWIRGTCQYGIMPANGLLYAPPHACACFAKVKLTGFWAAAHHRNGPTMRFSKAPALEKGPAFGDATGAAGDGDWPLYRRDARRRGLTAAGAPASLDVAWSADIGGRLTQAVIASGTVYCASIDTHTVHALDANNGESLWQFTAGGRIDSAPAFYKGYVIFGCADGWIYSLNGADGRLAWRFRAAPREQFVGAFDQIESSWPVHGAVLIQNDTIYAAAGRNSYLDGGMVLYRIDPLTGAELSRTPIYNLDPETDLQTGGEGGFDMQGVKTDLLSGDGENVYIKHMGFDRSGAKMSGGTRPHLMAAAGLLDELWFVRSYWLLGTNVKTGWGGWANVAREVPFGRILCFDGEKTYGYGRVKIASGATGHKLDAYHLFCKAKPDPAETPPPGKDRRGKKRRRRKPAPKTVWSQTDSLTVRAMVVAGDTVIVAGPPDRGKKDPKILQFKNENEALAAFTGKKGVFLRTISAKDGTNIAEVKLDTMPVFDGMSAAGGKLFIAFKNGTLECRGR